VIPHVLWLWFWTWPVLAVTVFNWLATLFAGRTEPDVHGFIGRYLRYQTHVYAYLLLVANPWPPFSGRAGTYPVDLELDPPEPQNRLTVFFRIVLVIPAYVMNIVLSAVAQFVAFIGWFVVLVLGRMPRGMRDLTAYCLRYQAQFNAYAYVITGRYPSLASGSGFQFEEG
jgi:uncharacterized protein DUF4389